MDSLVTRVVATIRGRQFFKAGDRVAAAVSGGADSVALLFLLLEVQADLGIVLSVAHVNHKLRGEESDGDEQFVAQLARQHNLELFVCAAPPIPANSSGIEAAARKVRYEFFRRLIRESQVNTIATAHTLDDQAETVLLRILRGCGIRGLSGIHPRIACHKATGARGEIVRPLLEFRRAELQAFLGERKQAWREDSTNRDLKFLRNRVRHVVLPTLREQAGAAVEENLANLAEIARAEEEHWDLAHPEIRWGGNSVPVAELGALPLAARRRAVRNWMNRISPDAAPSFRMIEDILELAQGSAGTTLEISKGRRVRRTQDAIEVEKSRGKEPAGYEYTLSIPGEVGVPQLGIRLRAILETTADEVDRDCLLDADRLPAVVTVRNWRPGDPFWPAHTKEPRKVKELLTDHHRSGAEKKLWPVITAGGELIWMRGFATPAALQPGRGCARVVRIMEIPMR